VAPPPQKEREVPAVEGERIIFVDEPAPGHYLKVIASGALDASLLEALEDFMKRRKKRLLGAGEVSDDGESRQEVN
jgi:hypothetical protein